MIIDSLANRAKKHYGVCVGLDTSATYLPPSIMGADISPADKIFRFNKQIIDATANEAACFKLQIAYYEALGLEGLKAYSATLKYLKQKDCLSIADIKRGDIAASGEQYAAAHFDGDFEADMATVNVYMGKDSVTPYFNYIRDKGKAIFALVKTSNPSSSDIQDISIGEGKEKLYERVGKMIEDWASPYLAPSGFTSIGAVMGLTYAQDFDRIKAHMPHTFFLIPGYGAQGGTGRDLAAVFKEGICGVVNSSRGIICAHMKEHIDEGFADLALEAVIKMKRDISQWL